MPLAEPKCRYEVICSKPTTRGPNVQITDRHTVNLTGTSRYVGLFLKSPNQTSGKLVMCPAYFYFLTRCTPTFMLIDILRLVRFLELRRIYPHTRPGVAREEWSHSDSSMGAM